MIPFCFILSQTSHNQWLKHRNKELLTLYLKSMWTDVVLLLKIFCEPGKMNTQIGNADQRSIYVNSPNKCKLQMVTLILMKEIHIFLQLSRSFAGAMTSQTLFLAMVCIVCVDVGKDNSHTVSFFICLNALDFIQFLYLSKI